MAQTKKKTKKRKTVRRKKVVSQPKWSDLIGGVLAIGTGLYCIALFINVLNVPNYSEVDLNPVVKGIEVEVVEQTAETVQLEETETISVPSISQPEEEVDSPVEEVTPTEIAEEETKEVSTAEVNLTSEPSLNLDPAYCSNYTFYQVDISAETDQDFSIVLREKDKKSTLTIIESLSKYYPSSDKTLQLVTEQADSQDCQLIFFTAKAKTDQAPKEGIFSYNIQTGEFKELATSSHLKGYRNFRFNTDFSEIIIIHDNQQLEDTAKVLEIINLSDDKATTIVQLDGIETFNSGEGFGGFGGLFGWADDEQSVYFDVYEEGEAENIFIEQRIVKI